MSARTPRSGRYDALEPRPPSPHHDPTIHNSPSSMSLPLEDLDFDLPPGASRPQFYNQGFGVRHSYAESLDAGSTRLPSENPSFAALPVDGHSATYGTNTHYQQYYNDSSQVSMSQLGPHRDFSAVDVMEEKRAMYANAGRSQRRTWFILGGLAALLLVAGAAFIGVYFGVIKPHQNQSDRNHAPPPTSSSGASSGPKNLAAISGGDGSIITMEDGTNITYNNAFGGFWWSDPGDPFANKAQAQSWTPPLNTSFKWGQDKIHGVNIGGWLNTEPFISPKLFEQYTSNGSGPVDEWTLSIAMAADTAGGGLGQLEQHYKTFITEKDFAEIAGAGLNFVRIPLPYWAIEVHDGEPFLSHVAWKYFLKAIEWCRKYGIRIQLDYHALPGSQNGWNHSGRLGEPNLLNGIMGLANAQRALSHISLIAEFISQPQYRNVVVIFGITNEPQGPTIGQEALKAFYLQAYNIVRQASGIGEGNGPMIACHDAFLSPGNWKGYLQGADRVALDTHPYFAFGGQSNSPVASYAQQACQAWGPMMNNSMADFGLTFAGEWSVATNDCGKFVNGVGLGTRYAGTFQGGPTTPIGSCDQWENWESWSDDTKRQLKQFALASMDALQNWFFWNWKIGNDSNQNIRAPVWSYQLGLEQGWMPSDPRSAAGACQATAAWNGPLAPWQTGGAGAGSIPPSATSTLVWPPATISNAGPVSLLPVYTPTGAIPTLAVPTFTASNPATTFNAGSGWQNPQDTQGLYVPISGCPYPDPWSGVGAPMPTATCGAATGAPGPGPGPGPGVATKREAAPALITPAP